MPKWIVPAPDLRVKTYLQSRQRRYVNFCHLLQAVQYVWHHLVLAFHVFAEISNYNYPAPVKILERLFNLLFIMAIVLGKELHVLLCLIFVLVILRLLCAGISKELWPKVLDRSNHAVKDYVLGLTF